MSGPEKFKSLDLKIQNYKSFGSEPQGFDRLCAVNVLVGRNNSGKSALLDLIEFACTYHVLPPVTRNKAGETAVLFSTTMSKEAVSRIFKSDTSHGPIPGNHWDYGRKFVDKKIVVELLQGGKRKFISIEPDEPDKNIRQMLNTAVQKTINPLQDKKFWRLSADRDIAPEQDQANILIGRNGQGFTNAVQRFINKSSLPSRLVEQRLLGELNAIFAPDSLFTNIRVRQHDDGVWEIYLEEESKGGVPLSHSGSGLKTVLLVLALLILVPHLEKKPISEFVFAFEELENNLHPAMQRRLIRYICDTAQKEGCIVFLTTHSGAIIDMLGHEAFAQIIHVTHSGDQAIARHATTYVENRGILDDLDVRASDLLQSNSIVWVEGPSDRLYFNRWVDLYSDGTLQEGTHYQCVFYGGRLLAHLSGAEPFDEVDTNQAVRIFRVNRNAIVLIDSDREREDDDLNETKQRIISEIAGFGGFSWVTAGKEVENYIPSAVLRGRYPDLKSDLGRYEDIGEFLERYKAGAGKSFEKRKVLFAERLLPSIHRDHLTCLDLENQLQEVVRRICRWNGISK